MITQTPGAESPADAIAAGDRLASCWGTMTRSADQGSGARRNGKPKADPTPVVLIASVSPHESRLVERALSQSGWTLLPVDDAGRATRALDGGERNTVLVIDSGLLEMAHDSQWRVLRAHHPELRTVVRCLTPRTRSLESGDGRTLRVHPDDLQAMREGIRWLCAGAPGLTRGEPSEILAYTGTRRPGSSR